MKKLFTLIAFLAVVMGAKAEWVEDYSIDYSTYTGFPFYVMGYVPEWYDGVMTDFGAMYKYVEATADATETSDVTVKTQGGTEYYKIALTEPGWHQYFIADGIPTEIDGSYKVTAMVKASEACTINVNMGWGWGDGQTVGTSVAIGTDWAEVEWEYSGIAGTSCNLVAQPGTCQATIEWKWVKVTHNQKAVRPIEWIEQLENGDAEKSWASLGYDGIKFDDMENNFKVCAWSKEKGVNVDDNGAWNPFPATIEDDGTGNHVFVCHANVADTEGDAAAWDNQFWIQSPKSWKEGTQIKVHFRYKASQTVKTNTQIHKQKPSDYLHWNAVGDVTFTTEWQDFDKVFTFDASMASGWSIAFNLNPEVKDAVDFYFDDLSWSEMKLDHGYFLAGANPDAGLQYDLDTAIEMTYDEESGCYVATVGTEQEPVSQIMVSTVRGNDAAFKSATLKPAGSIVNDPDTWLDYTEASLAKLTLPGVGIWKVYVDEEYRSMAFEMLWGETKEPIVINPNPTETIINALERDWRTADQDGNPVEEQIGTGQPWDNQFWLVANRELSTGDEVYVEFEYMATKDAKVTTQLHAAPGSYVHWNALGDINFTTEWQKFSKTFVIPNDNGNNITIKSIAFNMAEIKEANDYHIKNVIWKLSDDTESLISQTATDQNFVWKVVGGEQQTSITNVNANAAASKVLFNLAGQKVNKDYKGIVIKNGTKVIKK